MQDLAADALQSATPALLIIFLWSSFPGVQPIALQALALLPLNGEGPHQPKRRTPPELGASEFTVILSKQQLS